MRTINLTEDEVATLFRLIYNHTSHLEDKIKYFRSADKNLLADTYESEMGVLDTIGKKVMHSRNELLTDSKLKMREHHEGSDNY
jgi:hypothetical protein